MSQMTEPRLMVATIFLSIIYSVASLGHLTQLSTRSVSGRVFSRLNLLEIIVFTFPWYFSSTLRSVPTLVAVAVTVAPMFIRVSIAALPTTPHPHTRALIPGAPPRPLTNLPQPPLLLIIAHRPMNAPAFPAASQLGDPYLCESSAAKEIIFFSRSLSTSSLWAAGCTQQKSIWFSLRRSYSEGSISFTLATMSHVAQISSLVSTIVAPATLYSMSSKPALTPAPLATYTSCPSPLMMLTSAGVATTRYSPFLISLSIPNFILLLLFIALVLFAFMIWRVGLCGNFAPATHRKNDFNTITTNRKMFSPLW